MTEAWVVELRAGRPEVAWDLFLERYRRLIFAAIRHYAQDYDDVMDVFARVCEALREADLKRLRSFVDQPEHRARFSTWLVTVVRHLTIDWFRHRDGRRRLSVVADGLPPLQRTIFEHVFLERRSHVEAFELLRARDAPNLTFGEYLVQLRATYRAVSDGRRGHVLREFGGPPPVETETPSTPVGRISLSETSRGTPPPSSSRSRSLRTSSRLRTALPRSTPRRCLAGVRAAELESTSSR